MNSAKRRCDIRSLQYENALICSPQMYRAAQTLCIPSNDTAAAVSSYVLGPVLGGFVRWVLFDAVKNGKKRLYFLARDGYLMYRAALIFCKELHLPIECRYLSCSRYSLRIPMFHLDHETALSYVCRGGIDVTLLKILDRAGLTQEEKEQVIQELSLPFSPTEFLPYASLSDIRRRLSQCDSFLAYMDGHSRQSMPNLAGYLDQEGLLEELPYAIVDSGWVGSMQQTLSDVLCLLGKKRHPEGYYFGLYEIPDHADPSKYHCYYFRPQSHLRRKVHFNNCLFEAVFTAPHGMTLSYKKEGDRYLPCYGSLSESRKQFLLRSEHFQMRYIHALVLELQKTGFYKGIFSEDQAAIQKLLRQFMAMPSKSEAAVFGSLPFSDDVLDTAEQPIAAPLTESELRQNHVIPKLLSMTRFGTSYVRESAWYEGSAVLSDRHVLWHLRQHNLYKYIRYLRKWHPIKALRALYASRSKNGSSVPPAAKYPHRAGRAYLKTERQGKKEHG